MGKLKSTVERVLRVYPPLFRLGSTLYHKLNSSFDTLSPGTPEALSKAFALAQKQANGQPLGDYYEFGLFRGYTFLQAFKHCERLGLKDIHFYGFDSFQGLPAPANDLDSHGDHFFEGQFACSRDKVMANLMENGMQFEKTTLIEGFYEDSLTEGLRSEHDFKPASVILLDCDYYSSTKTALDWLTPYIADGTIILFDDWFSYGESEELGQQKAFAEFLETNTGFTSEPLWEFPNHGKGFQVKAK